MVVAIFSADELGGRQRAARLVSDGKAVRLAPGVFSDEVTRSPEEIVREQWRPIVGRLMAGAVITDRSGFDGLPHDGVLYVSHRRSRVVNLPGLVVLPRQGDGPLPGDTPLGDGLFQASEQRALLDNLAPSRAVGGRPSRTLTRSELHDQVVRLVANRNQQQQHRLLERVAKLGRLTSREADAESVDVFFQAARGERPTVSSDSPAMRAAQSGAPYDEHRHQLFKAFASELRARAPKVRPDPDGRLRSRFAPFFESYFSNYIEGTEFTVAEAAEISLEGVVPAGRPADAHDILGTYRIVFDRQEMSTPLASADDFLDALKRRHAAVMEGRPEKHPGEFKSIANRAGMTEFVTPAQVEGTLRSGWRLLEGLDDPFKRAAYMMFLVSEVHPFDDGNGRVARIMMNAELVSAEETRIIIPTVLRADYLSALSKLTHHGRGDSLINILDFAQQYTAQVDFSTVDSGVEDLGRTHAFVDALVAEREGIQLMLPSSVRKTWDVTPTSRQTTWTRRRDTGQPGNGGKFDGRERPDADVSL